jgi:hypothetical protein
VIPTAGRHGACPSIGSGKHEIGPARDDTKPLQSACGDRIAAFTVRDMAEAPLRINPSADDVDEEGLRGEFARRRRCTAAISI